MENAQTDPGWPACVIVRMRLPIVMLPCRLEVVAFAATVYRTSPLPVPLAPEAIVIHPTSTTAVHWQLFATVTDTVPVAPDAGIARAVSLRFRLQDIGRDAGGV